MLRQSVALALPYASLCTSSALASCSTSSSTLARAPSTLVGLWRRYSADASSRVVDLKADSEFQTVVKKHDGLAVVDFTAKWCGPCKAIAPIYEQLSKDHPSVKFTKVDIDDPELAGTVLNHSISSVPTFVFYKAGKKVASFSGAQRDQLLQLVNKHK